MKKDNESSKLIVKGLSKFRSEKSSMSLTAYQTLADEIKQIESQKVLRSLSGDAGHKTTQHKPEHEMFKRSLSVSGDNKPYMFHQSARVALEQRRKALYGSLPFVATYGMQHREKSIHDLLALASHEIHDESDEKQVISQEVDLDRIVVTVPLMLAAFVAIIAQFLVGYSTSVMNAPETVVFPGHTTTQWSMAVSAFAIGGPIGSIFGGVLANSKGRRGAMLLNTWIFLFGGLLMTFAPSAEWLIPARCIIGFAAGVSSVVVPVYLGEIAPPTLRGTLGTFTQFALVIGILFSDICAFPLATASGWRYLFGVTPALCVVQLLVSPFLLESPRWLLSRNDKSKHARTVIKSLRGYRSEEEVDVEVDNFLFAASKHKIDRSSAHSGGAMLDLLRDRDMHILVVSAVVLQMAQQLCGINAVFYYSTEFFEGIIDSPLMGTFMIAFVNVLATYVALKVMDNTARKTLILISSGGMLLSTFLVMGALQGLFAKWTALLAVMMFVSFFEIGLGPIPWLIVAEMFDAKYVATAMSLSCIVNWGCNFLVGLCFPFIQQSLGYLSFLPFAVVLACTIVFTYSYLPETHGRTVEEIHQFVRAFDDANDGGKHTLIDQSYGPDGPEDLGLVLTSKRRDSAESF